MAFQYTAKSKSGEITSGTLETDSLQEARNILRRQRLFPLNVEEKVGPTEQQATATERLTLKAIGAKKRIPRTEVLFFTTQLSIMCRSGIDLADAINNIAQQTTHEQFQEALFQIHTQVSNGQSVSVAMKSQPHAFDNSYTASIAAGEAAGQVPDVLTRLADLIRNELRLVSTLRQVMAYPVILMSVSGIVILALIFFVLPQFAKVFEDLGTAAPPLTQLLLSVSAAIRKHLLILSGFAFLCGCGAFVWAKSTSAKRLRDRLLLNFRPIREASRAVMIGRVFQLLGTMLESGIPLLESLQLCRASLRNLYYQSLFQKLEDEVISGRSMGPVLLKTDFIPKGAAQMIVTAEQTGNLGTVMNEVGSFFEDEGERQVTGLTKVLEPAIIVVTGIIVAVIVMSIMLPLLDVTTMSK